MSGSLLVPPVAPYATQGNIVAPYSPLMINATVNPVANQIIGQRIIVPWAGVLHGLSVFVITASGNVDLGIYNVAATSRTRLYSSGSTPVAGASAYMSVDPNLPVTRGQHLDLAAAFDNATVALGRFTQSNAGQMQLPVGFLPAPLGGVNLIGWKFGGAFPLPNPALEASFAPAQSGPWIGCYITPGPS